MIINVDQDTDEPWLLHLIDHEGRRHQTTLLPGEMLFYEQGRVSHSRPVALRGRYYDNCFYQTKMKDVKMQSIRSLEAAADLVKVNDMPAQQGTENGAGATEEF